MTEYIIKAADWAIDKNGNSLYQGCEEIVRCRDCKHYDRREMRDWRTGNPIGVSCVCEREEYAIDVESNGFCAWGERKTVNKTGDIVEHCSDDRFELIAKAKAELLDATNIESSPTDMAALDSILFRCWQMGWLDHLRIGERKTINKTGDFVTHDSRAKGVDA